MADYLAILCERCSKNERATAPHVCPFREDVYDDVGFQCTCCEACTQECRDDI